MAKKSKKKSSKSPTKKSGKKTAKKVAKKSSKKTATKKGGKKQTAVSKKRAGKDARSNPSPWSDKDVERLKKLISQNTPTPLIAMKLKRSLISVRGKVSRDGLSLAPTNRSPRD